MSEAQPISVVVWRRRFRGHVVEYGDVKASRLVVLPGGRMSALDRIVPQASQPILLNLLVMMVALGEEDPTWLQHQIGFKQVRNVHYYLEAARWARLIDEDTIRPTALGTRYVRSRFEPAVMLEGLRGRAFFEEVLRVAGTGKPTPSIVADVLRRWSFRYTKGTVTRRANDFCSLFGAILAAAQEPEPRRLVVQTRWVEPADLIAHRGVATLWPRLQVTPIKGIRRNKPTPAQRLDAMQLDLPLMEGK